MRRHHAHLEQLDERFTPLEQAVAFEQRLFFERLEVLRDGMDEVGIGDVFGDEIVVGPVQLARQQLLQLLTRLLNG